MLHILLRWDTETKHGILGYLSSCFTREDRDTSKCLDVTVLSQCWRHTHESTVLRMKVTSSLERVEHKLQGSVKRLGWVEASTHRAHGQLRNWKFIFWGSGKRKEGQEVYKSWKWEIRSTLGKSNFMEFRKALALQKNLSVKWSVDS